MTTSQSRLEGFRRRKDTFFKEHEQSPLTPAQKDMFTELKYFPENPDLSFVLDLDTSGDDVGEEITIGTVSGVAKEYIRAGRVTFPVDGQEATLTVFKEKARGNYFVPFRDITSGTETYEVGRYLEPRATPDGRIAFDLNLAYNPYCAYNSGWSCPIPPFENMLRVPIRAGEILPALPYDERESGH
ncbi:MAG TPA: DUF1684 domain-containing protein [Thermomicrobiales bacterium]|nr:DUF1684 domain-containing protein [Thermomicrobiales bacterium]